jgi:hypothetical protein
MKASELRIGNLIYQDGEVTEVLRLNSTTINSSGEDDCSGIPLTEEWLIRAGFELSYTGSDFKNYRKEGFDQLADYGVQCVVLKEKHPAYLKCGYYENEIDCQYIHQLQNLFYCLTGEELTINP